MRGGESSRAHRVDNAPLPQPPLPQVQVFGPQFNPNAPLKIVIVLLLVIPSGKMPNTKTISCHQSPPPLSNSPISRHFLFTPQTARASPASRRTTARARRGIFPREPQQAAPGTL